jgi:preprotein translocase SecE subunit
MSRAIRRHPPAQKAKAGKRAAAPPALRPQPKRRQQREAPEGRGLSALLRPRWAEDIISELRKVTWPSREDTQYLTFVVLVVAAAFGIFLGGVDLFFNWAIDHTIIP